MPYTVSREGMDEITKKIEKMGDDAIPIAKKALYKGAGIVAEEVKTRAANIKTAPFHYAVFVQRDPSPEEKEIAQKGVGIAKFNTNGNEVNTSIGYSKAGYAMLAGKRKPIPLIINSINHGTSFMRKQPFVRQAATVGGAKAKDAMVQTMQDEIDAIIKE